MSKFFSKTIVIVALATLLWGGVGLDNKIFAADTLETLSQACGPTPSSQNDPNYESWNKCRNEWNARANQLTKNNGECGWDFTCHLKNAGAALLDGVSRVVVTVVNTVAIYLILPILAKLTLLAGLLLDVALKLNLSHDYNGLIKNTITPAWEVIRNTLNIAFIFILLWISLKKIVGVDSNKTKELLSSVIVAALLINFSLFATKIAIDAGNILGASFINIIERSVNTEGSVSKFNSKDINLSEHLMHGLKINAAWGTGSSKTDEGSLSLTSEDTFFKVFIQLVLSLVTTIAFAVVAFLFIGRIIALIFLMILSPIGFMGGVIPALKEYSDKWRKNLYSQVMVLPVFLFFMLLALLLIKNLGALSTGAKYTGTNPLTGTGYEFDLSYYINYILLIGTLLFSVKITKSFSGEVGAVFDKAGSAVVGFGLGLATGGVAMLGRQTVGRAAAGLAGSGAGKWLQTKADSGNWASKMALKGITNTSKATFDARNSKTFKNGTGYLNEQMGVKVDYGKAGGKYGKGKDAKGGYAGWIEEKKKKAEEEGKEIDKRRYEYENDPSRSAYVAKIKSQIDQRAGEQVNNNSNPAIKTMRERELSEYDQKIAKLDRDVSLGLGSGQQQRDNIQALAKIKAEKEAYQKKMLEAEKLRASRELFEDDKNAQAVVRKLNAQKKHAETIRSKFWSMRTTGQNATIAEALAKGKYDKAKEDKAKEKKEEAKALAEAIKEQGDDKKDNGGEEKKDKK